VNEVIEGVSQSEAPKRIHRSAEEKRRIVEATFAPGTSIARVAREHGVNSNQVFQWRYEYRKGTLGGRSKPAAKLLPVVMADSEAPSSVAVVAPQANSSGTIHVEFPGGVSVHIGRDTDLHLLRAVVEILRA
jgi:transposase